MSQRAEDEQVQPPSSKLEERRASVRYTCRGISCSVRILTAPEPAWLQIRTLSEQGIGFVQNRPLRPGTEMPVEVINSAGTFSRTLAIKVRHASRRPQGDYLIGAEFVEFLSHQDLCTLLGWSPRIPLSEKAILERVPFHCPACQRTFHLSARLPQKPIVCPRCPQPVTLQLTARN